MGGHWIKDLMISKTSYGSSMEHMKCAVPFRSVESLFICCKSKRTLSSVNSTGPIDAASKKHVLLPSISGRPSLFR
ncbi:hypothetical protein TNCV_1319931 [Trichonephila clavipes]|nr:hypothetical protein TNCV_1319931 [Trichonephila clavipes]